MFFRFTNYECLFSEQDLVVYPPPPPPIFRLSSACLFDRG